MEIKGEYKIAAPREKVFAALNDPDVLRACIPGCQSLDKLSDTEMTAKVRLKIGPVLPEIVLAFLLIFWAAVMLVTEGAIKLYDGGAGGFVAADGGRWVVRTLFWNTQADWFAALAVLMAVPYLATIYVSAREPLAELPPDSYTSKW